MSLAHTSFSPQQQQQQQQELLDKGVADNNNNDNGQNQKENHGENQKDDVTTIAAEARTTATTSTIATTCSVEWLTAAIVVVAKCPWLAKSKTRLIPLLGAEGACRLARAMLSDVLLTLSSCPELKNVRKVLLYAPPTAEGLESMKSILENVMTHIPKDLQPQQSTHWDLLPVLSSMSSSKLQQQQQQSTDHSSSSSSTTTASSNLGPILTDALIRVRQLQKSTYRTLLQEGRIQLASKMPPETRINITTTTTSSSDQQQPSLLGPVLFTGMDIPEVPLEEILAALQNPSTAWLCPAADGGYSILSVPYYCSAMATTTTSAAASPSTMTTTIGNSEPPPTTAAFSSSTSSCQEQPQEQQQQQQRMLSLLYDCELEASKVFLPVYPYWSHSMTAMAQLKALTDAGVTNIRIGRLVPDVDEPADVMALCQRILEKQQEHEKQEQFAINTTKTLREHEDCSLLRPSASCGSPQTGSLLYTRMALQELGQLPSPSSLSSPSP